MPPGPIGLFDSGVGGLTVATEIRKAFPQQTVIYIADQFHVPYGGRPASEIKQFAGGISRFLANSGCEMIVMACNISSATALDEVRQEHPNLSIFGVVQPGARAAAADTRNNSIGVLATLGTTNTREYTRHISLANPDCQTTEVACPRFVPLVESGQTGTAGAVHAATEYLTPLAEQGCDTIILGCTHYPYLMPAIHTAARDLFSEMPRFIDPAKYLVHDLGLLVPSVNPQSPANRFYTTSDPVQFRLQAGVLEPSLEGDFSALTWNNGILEVGS
ncbi:MAG: glutamate racemase [Chthonomonadales bacterium]